MINPQLHPIILPLMLAAVAAGIITAFAWRLRTPGSRQFAWMTLFISLWAIGYAMELQQTTLDGVLFWIHVQYVGITVAPVLLFLFVAAYTDAGSWAHFPRALLFFGVPVLVQGLLWTNQWHQLHYIDPGVTVVDGFTMLRFEPGISYWGNVIYSYSLVITALALLGRAQMTAGRHIRRQMGILFAGVLIPWLGNVLYMFVLRPESGVDVTPITFTLSGAIIAFGIYRYQFLDLAPVARATLVDTMEDAWIVLDDQDRIVDLNTTARRLLQCRAERVTGRQLQGLLPDAHPLVAALANGREERFELAADYCQHGRTFDVRLSSLTDRRGATSGHLLVLRDISERKQAENALRQLNDELEGTVKIRTAEIEVARDRMEAILRTVQEGILLLTPRLEVAYVNAGMLALLHNESDELSGKALDALPIWSEEYPCEPIRQALLDGHTWQGEVPLRGKWNQAIPCATFAAPVNGGTGHVQGYIATFRDISELKQLDRARRQFISSISHELRSPLTNLTLYVELLERTADESKRQHYTDILRQQTQRMERLAQVVIDLARLDSSHTIARQPLPAPVDLFDNVLGTFSAPLWQHRLQTIVEGDGIPAGTLQGDPALIERAVGELLKNAISFSPEEGVIRLVAGQTSAGGRQWTTLSVSDSGPGIPDREQQAIFQRFYRGAAGDARSVPGFGLGLSLVEEIMRVHNGHTTISSTPAWGSTFTLWFPRSGPGSNGSKPALILSGEEEERST